MALIQKLESLEQQKASIEHQVAQHNVQLKKQRNRGYSETTASSA